MELALTFPKRKAKWMLWVLAGVAIVALFVFAQIDDWRRDLRTNVAATDGTTDDLRPLTLGMPRDQALEKLRQAVQALPRWQEVAPPAGDPEPAVTRIHLVRTTPILRFKDDIHVRLVASDDGLATTVHVRSQSRIGRGDLGQNPRNIRELLGKLEAVAGD